MKRLIALAGVALLVCTAVALRAEEEKAPELKCPVSGKAATKDHAASHNGGNVYFCCDNCPKAFAADTAKYAPKANEQLVQTRQAKQVKCPLSGGKLNPEEKVTVDAIEVKFCCEKCKGKVAAATAEEQLNLCLSDEAFKKGFEVTKEDQ